MADNKELLSRESPYLDSASLFTPNVFTSATLLYYRFFRVFFLLFLVQFQSELKFSLFKGSSCAGGVRNGLDMGPEYIYKIYWRFHNAFLRLSIGSQEASFYFLVEIF